MSQSMVERARERIILALDVPAIADGEALLDRLEGRVGLIKVGLELFTACGPAAVEAVLRRGFGVFLDLKLHDIPATVAGAVRSARGLGARMLTIHTGGGTAMLEAAVTNAGPDMKILGVTLLTSMGQEDLAPVCIAGAPSEVVIARAALAARAGCGGLVCSPKEVALVRRTVGPTVSLITPGIRPSGAAAGDQKRAATPGSAIADGADYLVVGRPIRDAEDPSAAADAIAEEIARALEAR